MSRYKRYKMKWNYLRQFLRAEQHFIKQRRSRSEYDLCKERVLCDILHLMITLDGYSYEQLKEETEGYIRVNKTYE